MSKENAEPGPEGLSGLVDDLDLEKYEVRAVAADLTEIANLPKAVAAAVGRALLMPLVIAVVTWLLFSDRMSTLALVAFTLVAAVLSLGAAAVVAVMLFTRRQAEACIDASERVLGVVSEMHGDLARLRAGDLRLTVRETATTLSSEVVFPMIEEMGVGAVGTVLRGPLRVIAGPLVGVPVGVVEKSVASAIGALPLDFLDSAIEVGDEHAGGAEARLAAVEASVVALGERYQSIQASIDGVVKRAMRRSLAPVLLAAIATAIPLLIWWLLGLALT